MCQIHWLDYILYATSPLSSFNVGNYYFVIATSAAIYFFKLLTLNYEYLVSQEATVLKKSSFQYTAREAVHLLGETDLIC